MCSSQLISALLHSFLFCTRLNVTLTGGQREFLFVCLVAFASHGYLCYANLAMGPLLQFMVLTSVDFYALTGLVGGGWYLSLGDGGWYTWPGDWVQSSRQGQRFHPPRHCNTLNTTRTCVQHQWNILILKINGNCSRYWLNFAITVFLALRGVILTLSVSRENAKSRIYSALGWLAMVPRASGLLLMFLKWGNASH